MRAKRAASAPAKSSGVSQCNQLNSVCLNINLECEGYKWAGSKATRTLVQRCPLTLSAGRIEQSVIESQLRRKYKKSLRLKLTIQTSQRLPLLTTRLYTPIHITLYSSLTSLINYFRCLCAQGRILLLQTPLLKKQVARRQWLDTASLMPVTSASMP